MGLTVEWMFNVMMPVNEIITIIIFYVVFSDVDDDVVVQ